MTALQGAKTVPAVTVSDAVLVAEAPAEERRWGRYQFPTLDRMRDGRIALSFHVNEDSARAYGKRPALPGRGAMRADETRERAALIEALSAEIALLAALIAKKTYLLPGLFRPTRENLTPAEDLLKTRSIG